MRPEHCRCLQAPQRLKPRLRQQQQLSLRRVRRQRQPGLRPLAQQRLLGRPQLCWRLRLPLLLPRPWLSLSRQGGRRGGAAPRRPSRPRSPRR